MASSISLWAASLLLACGLSMLMVEWDMCTGRPNNSAPFIFKALIILLCSENSISAYLFGSLSLVQNRTYLTSPAVPKKSISCCAEMAGSKLEATRVLRISSILTES